MLSAGYFLVFRQACVYCVRFTVSRDFLAKHNCVVPVNNVTAEAVKFSVFVKFMSRHISLHINNTQRAFSCFLGWIFFISTCTALCSILYYIPKTYRLSRHIYLMPVFLAGNIRTVLYYLYRTVSSSIAFNHIVSNCTAPTELNPIKSYSITSSCIACYGTERYGTVRCTPTFNQNSYG